MPVHRAHPECASLLTPLLSTQVLSLPAWCIVLRSPSRADSANNRRLQDGGDGASGDDQALDSPRSAVVKCMGDAGFFLDTPGEEGDWRMRRLYQGVVNMQVRREIGRSRVKERWWLAGLRMRTLSPLTSSMYMINARNDHLEIGS